MALKGRITVTSGPDRGKSFELADELVRVGKGDGNQIILSDATAADTHLNILQREGRFAVLTQVPDGITVEGNAVPPERWVWLPNTALIQLTRRTAVEFQLEEGDVAQEESVASEVAALPDASTTTLPVAPQSGSMTTSSAVLPKPRRVPSPVPMPLPTPPAETATPTAQSPTDSTASGEKLKKKRASTDKLERKTVTARFITDGPGDPLVKLGEDGHLPELQLEDGRKKSGQQQEAKRTSPVWVVLILAFGFGSSLLMLFLDFEGLGGTAQEKTQARQDLVSYYADVKGPLQPFQIHLRQAQRARSRRDYSAERAEYRQVLKMLRAEGKNPYTGVTGSEARDLELERLMGVLLRE